MRTKKIEKQLRRLKREKEQLEKNIDKSYLRDDLHSFQSLEKRYGRISHQIDELYMQQDN